ncbi:glycosyltransferase [Paenibacillus tuaregi]|uniref:glycosyltransferase n=1 Tax=Paenibacillus tuaregi TaxID=1816681 RepID=UPI000839269E|nr:glycosyltransferase [Paenibacillus tuaregi]
MLTNVPAVSVIIAVKNEGINLMMTLESMKVSKTDIPYEVIIVDDQSMDCCCEFLYEYRFPMPIHYVKTEGIGAAAARNRGALAAKGEICVFCSGHMYVDDYWMEGLVQSIRSGSTDCVSPSISAHQQQDRIGYGLSLKLPELTVEWITDRDDLGEAPVLPWQCIAVRRELFVENQGFEAGFRQEEAVAAEFSLRMRLLGFRCRIEPSVNISLVYRTVFPYVPPVDYRDYHLLRLAYLHFNEERLEKSRRVAGEGGELQKWESELLEDGVLQLREQYLARRQFDDSWFFDRYQIEY